MQRKIVVSQAIAQDMLNYVGNPEVVARRVEVQVGAMMSREVGKLFSLKYLYPTNLDTTTTRWTEGYPDDFLSDLVRCYQKTTYDLHAKSHLKRPKIPRSWQRGKRRI